MIRRPTANSPFGELELRLVQYAQGAAPVVTKQLLNMSQYSNSSDGSITMGPMTMTPNSATGTVGGVAVHMRFGLDGRKNEFLPPVLQPSGADAWLSSYVPTVTSFYGTGPPAGSGSFAPAVGDYTFQPGANLVHTTYPVPIGLGIVRWAMASAGGFEGTNLQVEVVAMPLPDIIGHNLPIVKQLLDCTDDNCHLAPSYVRLDGHEYHIDKLINLVQVDRACEYNPTQTVREFSATMQVSPFIGKITTIQLNCSAPVGQFAFLEKEGNTYIHTTTMADCSARITCPLYDKTFHSVGRNLMELKQ
jgi:hypothetical protein